MKKLFFSAIMIAFLGTFSQANTAHNGEPDTEPATISFQDFLQQFPSGDLPYSFSEQDLQHQLDIQIGLADASSKPQRLGWEYYDFLPDLEELAEEMQMPIYPEPVVAFETESSYAVVYNTGRAFAQQFKAYNIAIFNKDGEHQATYTIAGVEPETLTSATLDEALQVTIKEYEVKWEMDVEEAGMEGNAVNSIDLKETRNITLIEQTAENQLVAEPIEVAQN